MVIRRVCVDIDFNLAVCQLRRQACVSIFLVRPILGSLPLMRHEGQIARSTVGTAISVERPTRQTLQWLCLELSLYVKFSGSLSLQIVERPRVQACQQLVDVCDVD